MKIHRISLGFISSLGLVGVISGGYFYETPLNFMTKTFIDTLEFVLHTGNEYFTTVNNLIKEEARHM